MGQWAKKLFGQERIGDVGIIIAGHTPMKDEKEILSYFDEVISSKDEVYHAHLVKKGDKIYPIVSNVYGAPALMDVLTQMHDGGCRNIIFIGYAYSVLKNLDVGSIILAKKAYHFDGAYNIIDKKRFEAYPDLELLKKFEQILKKEKVNYTEGENISVPAVTFQLPHNNEMYRKINLTPVEMELAACYSRSKDIGMRSVGILIVSDTRSSSIGDETKRKIAHKTKINVLHIIINHLENLQLKPLTYSDNFKVSEYLASIIENPEDITNIYTEE